MNPARVLVACGKCGREVPSNVIGVHRRGCDPERDARLVRAYVDDLESVESLSARFGVSPGSVRDAIKRAGVPFRPRGGGRRRLSSSTEPACDRPRLPGWEGTGIDPPERMAAGLCLICAARMGGRWFDSVDELLGHYWREHRVARVQPPRKCRECFEVIDERKPHECRAVAGDAAA